MGMNSAHLLHYKTNSATLSIQGLRLGVSMVEEWLACPHGAMNSEPGAGSILQAYTWKGLISEVFVSINDAPPSLASRTKPSVQE